MRSTNVAHSRGLTRARMPTRASSAANTWSISLPVFAPAEESRSNSNSRPFRSRVPSPFVSRHPAESSSSAAAEGSKGRGVTAASYAGESGAHGPEMMRAEPWYRLRTIEGRSRSMVIARRTRESEKRGDRLLRAM